MIHILNGSFCVSYVENIGNLFVTTFGVFFVFFVFQFYKQNYIA